MLFWILTTNQLFYIYLTELEFQVIWTVYCSCRYIKLYGTWINTAKDWSIIDVIRNLRLKDPLLEKTNLRGMHRGGWSVNYLPTYWYNQVINQIYLFFWYTNQSDYFRGKKVNALKKDQFSCTQKLWLILFRL